MSPPPGPGYLPHMGARGTAVGREGEGSGRWERAMSSEQVRPPAPLSQPPGCGGQTHSWGWQRGSRPLPRPPGLERGEVEEGENRDGPCGTNCLSPGNYDKNATAVECGQECCPRNGVSHRRPCGLQGTAGLSLGLMLLGTEWLAQASHMSPEYPSTSEIQEALLQEETAPTTGTGLRMPPAQRTLRRPA